MVIVGQSVFADFGEFHFSKLLISRVSFLLNYEVIFLRCYICWPVNLEICRNILLIYSAKFNCGFSSIV